MLPDRVSNPGPLTYESGALPIALRGPARKFEMDGMHERYRSTCIFSQAGEFASVVHIFRMRTGITGITVVKLCGCTG